MPNRATVRILLDNCVDRKFGRLLAGHDVSHARDMGWTLLENGELIAQAEANHFAAMITVDKNLRYQQNISNRKIGVIILNAKRITYPHISSLAGKALLALRTMTPGAFVVIGPDFP